MCLSTQEVVILSLLCAIIPVLSGCPTGWFGINCTYQCHCSNNNCDDRGECTPGSKCLSEWFGPACQYQDLFAIAVTSTRPPEALNVLKDQNDETCLNGDTEVVTITLNSSYVITWIRVTVKNLDFKRNITLVVTDAQGSQYSCSNTYMIDERTMDIFCDVQILTQQLKLQGRDVSVLCSLSISGGRNVALHQRAVQSSDLGIQYDAVKAVDGNRNTDVENGLSCTHTAVDDPSPNWNVTFSYSHMVHRYVLFNRIPFEQRLKTAQILSYNANNILVFNNTLPDIPQIVYVVTSPPQIVSYVKIYALYKPDMILTMCEVEIYGDSTCPNNRFGLECTKSCNCKNKTDACYVATGGCPSGCAAGFYGDGCQQLCPLGKWGVDCVNECSKHCINKMCDRTQGTCNLGCEDGFIGGVCNRECPELTWGTNCSNKCSPECFNKTCNITNGVCLFGCSSGYTGDKCNGECSQFTWGSGCSNNCSSHCVDETCDRRDGDCYNGCVAGYSGNACNHRCGSMTWGSNCKMACSDHCLNKTCHFTDGVCDYGCEAGYFGNICEDDDVSPLDYDYETVYNKGLASGIGIGVGSTLAVVAIICIVIYIWIKRRPKPESKPCDTTDRQYDRVGPVQQNEHQYGRLNKTGAVTFIPFTYEILVT